MVKSLQSGQLQGKFRKNKSAGLLQGKPACFPLWREAEQEADANHPFPQESALGRWILSEVANHGARAVIDSGLIVYSGQTVPPNAICINSGQTRFLFAL